MATADIIVLGATGFTGRLIVDYLAHHPQRASFTFSVAGRSLAKLVALRQRYALDHTVKFYPMDVSKQEQVEEAVKSARVVISTVGPFMYWGETVLKACLKHRRHYVDLCGETAWIREMVLKYDYVAAKAGVLLIPSCGFDSVPADLTVYLANKTLKAAAGPQASLGDSLSVYRAKGGFSGGTQASLMAIVENVPIDKLQEASVDYALAPATGKPGVKGRLWYEIPFSDSKRYAMQFFMASANRAIVQRSWGLNTVAAAATAAKSASPGEQEELARAQYGAEFTYDECMERWSAKGALGRLSVASASLMFVVTMAMLLLFPPVRWLFKRFGIPPGQGPSKEKMQTGFFEITNYSKSVPAPGAPEVHIKTAIHGRGDPGYLLSAKMVSECALAIALEKDRLPRMAQGGGILTPATAFGDVLVRRLEGTGAFSFESHVFSPEEESRKQR
ncbi:Saccharopine dehydrogenase-domain-containing protein [Rhodofomes roseus]|uniref:Saccharopine dehydrogenase-domain-containing protein n=1 Tax=Rhodofomes roseus TaxID=34475 RepID=A0ABQ8KAA2_9APHY|nr:Saccharopine dehydrogenase-domain-containing protein [Rhodofomes roseus]KAH9834188.1 Saccharopine dehydrogenase-domain-containing protein [Rhodofomes roseus]